MSYYRGRIWVVYRLGMEEPNNLYSYTGAEPQSATLQYASFLTQPLWKDRKGGPFHYRYIISLVKYSGHAKGIYMKEVLNWSGVYIVNSVIHVLLYNNCK